MEQANSHISNIQYYTAIAIFLLTYAILISEKMNRAVIALLGGTLMIVFGIVETKVAFTTHIQWETITLLLGMMILVNITSKSGVFEFLSIYAAKKAKGQPIWILIILSFLTAVGSAFLDNVTTVLLIVPVTLSVTRILKISPMPFFISEILFSNIGGTATLIGDPPNIMIGSANKHLDFNSFLFNLTPIIIIIGLVSIILLYIIYYRSIRTSDHLIEKLMSLQEHDYIKDRKLLTQSLTVLGGTVIGFVLHSTIHVDAAIIALLGATILMAIALKQHEVEDILSQIEWTTIFFFAGLFILVGGLVDIGLVSMLAQKMITMTGGNISTAATFILWGSGVASAIIDNIPFVATMIPLIQNFAVGLGLQPDSPQMEVLWWALSLGACLGGNGTIIGASANVVVAGIANREGHAFGFVDYLKIGLPLTIVALLLSNVYLYIRYFL
ncbi:ArsB/NhaD family transporter [Ectobacillus sp. sgz5001026]|uniref:ArsB/NhaD family transporter n=1 Tax=Ectobacillus sp. sgz5001026 TaxID=3242473 RepID=UPI0036D381E9